ncbi:urease accessory protein UreF [Gluconacetobacter johannae]|nr:urease accessory UreF family protein [Gluconacetobacter johannae]
MGTTLMPMGITTTTIMTMGTARIPIPDLPVDDATLARLLNWLSPAFPTGGFAYSHGLEWAVQAGDVTDVATLVDWIGDLLSCGSLRNDLILVRAAWQARDGAALVSLTRIGCALASSRERWEETTRQGEAFLRGVAVWGVEIAGRGTPGVAWPLPVAHGAALGACGAGEHHTLVASASAVTAGLVSAAVRLVPLGQTDALRALAALERPIAAAVAATQGQGIADLGGLCFRADLAAMHHETQETRLFRT